jgi:hypothetical protein
LGAGDDFHQLGNLTPLFGSIARAYRVLDAMADVITQDFFFYSPKRRTDGRNLYNDVDAVPAFYDHARKAAHLAFDPVEPFETGVLDVLTHGILYTAISKTTVGTANAAPTQTRRVMRGLNLHHYISPLLSCARG